MNHPFKCDIGILSSTASSHHCCYHQKYSKTKNECFSQDYRAASDEGMRSIFTKKCLQGWTLRFSNQSSILESAFPIGVHETIVNHRSCWLLVDESKALEWDTFHRRAVHHAFRLPQNIVPTYRYLLVGRLRSCITSQQHDGVDS